jgi:hypothetical protein
MGRDASSNDLVGALMLVLKIVFLHVLLPFFVIDVAD